MTKPLLLILGGTGEALDLAARLVAEGRFRVITSLAGRTANPKRPRGEVRIGGFGGAAGLADYLRAEEVSLLVDATHPFAAGITANAARAAEETALPLLRLARPAWRPEARDRWISVPDLAAAAEALPAEARRVLLTTGAKGLEAFAARPEIHYLLRLVDPPRTPPPLQSCKLIIARGPFAMEDETALFREKGVEVLVTKNSGGPAAKLTVARALGLPVVMVERPPEPPGVERCANIEALLAQLADLG